MLRKLNLIASCLFLLLSISCSEEKKQEEEKQPAETITSSQDNITTTNTISNQPTADSLETYIDFVYELGWHDKNTLYTELYINKELTQEDDKALDEISTTLIDSFEYESRKAIPLTAAKTHFTLSGTQFLSFYDESNVPVAKHVAMDHYELYKGLMESTYITTYTLPDTVTTALYAIGGKQPSFEKYRIHPIRNKVAIQAIDALFKKDSVPVNYTHSFDQYALENNTTLTIANTDELFYIFLTDEGQTKRLFVDTSIVNNCLTSVLLPIYKNGMPLLLCEMGQPATDFIWSSLLFFDGSQYTYVDKNRLKL